MQAQAFLDRALVQVRALPITSAEYRIGRSVARIVSDDARIDRHFRIRLAPFLAQSGDAECTTHIIALSRPDLTRACGLAEVDACEELDVAWLDTISQRQCIAAVSVPHRLVMLGCLADGSDLYWLAGYMTEMICGFAVGASAVVLHASAVATPWGGVVCVGTGGSGKTTLALALNRRAGCTFVADDTALLSLDGHGVVHLLPLFADVHLTPSTLRLMPHLPVRTDESARGFDITGTLLAQDPVQAEKFRINAAAVSPGWHSVSTPVRAVVFPSVSKCTRSSVLSTVPPDLGWAKLTSGVQPFLTDHWPGTIERQRSVLRAVLGQCSFLSLALGSDVDLASEMLCRALESASVEPAHGRL
jgi:hypothetical protein